MTLYVLSSIVKWPLTAIVIVTIIATIINVMNVMYVAIVRVTAAIANVTTICAIIEDEFVGFSWTRAIEDFMKIVTCFRILPGCSYVPHHRSHLYPFSCQGLSLCYSNPYLMKQLASLPQDSLVV